jgi:uncharacterized membrane protein YeaQ/YmgE (transglycosylase-associated protein family)
MTWEIIGVISLGAIGAFVRLIIKPDCFLEMPYMKNHKFFLGFIGAVLIGGAVGYLIDGSLITAFFAGYTGSSVIDKLAFKNQVKYPDASNDK